MAEGFSWDLGAAGDFGGFQIYKEDEEEDKALVEKKRLRDEVKKKPKLERVTLNNLPDKPIAQAGAFIRAKIVNLVNPWEFFVIPEKNWGCVSKSDEEDDVGWSHLLKLQEKLSRCSKSEKSIEFKVDELVLVRHHDINLSIFTGKSNKGYHRGLITKDYSTTEDNLSPPNVHLLLLDYGIELKKPLADVHVLDPKFALSPTLVYKCMLHGLSPIGVGKWDKETTNRFRELCLNKVCVLEIKNSYVKSTTSIKLYENENPYQVCVKVKNNENSYLNVGKKLISSHLAIAWNPVKSNMDTLTQHTYVHSDAAYFVLDS